MFTIGFRRNNCFLQFTAGVILLLPRFQFCLVRFHQQEEGMSNQECIDQFETKLNQTFIEISSLKDSVAQLTQLTTETSHKVAALTLETGDVPGPSSSHPQAHGPRLTQGHLHTQTPVSRGQYGRQVAAQFPTSFDNRLNNVADEQLNGATLGSSSTFNLTEDVQSAFQSVRDSVQSIRLPSDHRLLDSRAGIKRADQSMYNVIAKCGRYIETGLKILQKIDEPHNIRPADVHDLYCVLFANIRYLQDEFSSLLVNSTVNSETARIFRAFRRNTSGFDRQAISDLRDAASIVSAKDSTPQYSRGSRGGRFNWRGGSGRGFRPRQSDAYQNFYSQRQVAGRGNYNQGGAESHDN